MDRLDVLLGFAGWGRPLQPPQWIVERAASVANGAPTSIVCSFSNRRAPCGAAVPDKPSNGPGGAPARWVRGYLYASSALVPKAPAFDLIGGRAK